MPPIHWRGVSALPRGRLIQPRLVSLVKPSRVFLPSLFAAAASAAFSQSGPEEPLVELADYIVETNAATIDRKAPSVAHQILASDLGALNLPETAAALNHLPNVFVRQRFVGDKNALVSIRGTSNRQPGRTLVLADGMLLSNFLGTGFGNSPRWFLIAPEEIEKIAVSYGPYSPLYAGNSIGGVVLFTTRMPAQSFVAAKGQLMAQTFREYATDETFTGRAAYVAAGGQAGRFSWFAFVNHLDNDSQPMSFQTVGLSQTSAPGSGEVDTTGAIADLDPAGAARLVYGSEGPTRAAHDLFKLKLAAQLTPVLHARYTVAWWVNEEDRLHPETYLRDAAGNPVWSGRVEAAGRAFTVPANAFNLGRRDQSDLIHALVLAREPARGLRFTLSGSLYDVLEDDAFSSSAALPDALSGGAGLATLVGRTGWRNLDALFGWRALDGPLASHAPTAGYHIDHFFTRQDQWSLGNWRDPATRAALAGGAGGATRTQALFAQDVWSLAPDWTLTPGVRWETWEAFDGYHERDFDGARVRSAHRDRRQSGWSPKLAIGWRPSRDWNARLSLARAHRFPTVGELFQGSISANGSITQNDPDLKPERDFAKDLTIERAFAGGVARVSFFEEDVRDALVSQSIILPDGTSFSGVQNVGRVRTRGAEFALEAHRLLSGALDVSFNASHTDAVIVGNPGLPASVGKQFPRIPKTQWKTTFDWRATSWLRLSGATRWSGRQHNTLDNSDSRGGFGGVDDFFVVDAKAAFVALESAVISIGVNNLTDCRYHVYHPMPGRAWFAECNWRY